jgi:ribonucleoside-diphosphate reductase beta chain
MDLIDENPEIWTPEFREELRETMREGVRLEKEFIADCLPIAAVGLTKEEFLTYIDYIGDRRLEGVGLEPLNGPITNPLPWLAEMMDLRKESNFFESRVTDYRRAAAIKDADDDEL